VLGKERESFIQK